MEKNDSNEGHSNPDGKARESLAPIYGILRRDEDVRDDFIAQTTGLEYRRNPEDVASFHVSTDRFVQHGDKHNAIRVLMGSDPAWPSFQADSLMACVVAAASGPEYFERTTKMVAINLIARGDIDRGIQLLVLVGKADEACRYLQDAGKWEASVRLAKLQLDPKSPSYIGVFRKWADHLLSVNDFPRVVLVLLALGDISRVISVLHGKDRFQLAVQLMQYFKEIGQFEATPEESAILESVHSDYGFFLHRLGLEAEAEKSFNLAGPVGQQMLEAVREAPPELNAARSRGNTSTQTSNASPSGFGKKLLNNLKGEILDLAKKK